jgi:CheY-like chemotaxis protein
MSASFKVYVVDDDPVVLDIMHAILEPDCQVETFPSAEDCLMQLESEKPDFFLLDVNLPGMDGYAVAAALRKQATLAATPIIAVTSYAMVGDREQILAAGATGYIEKPINPESFVAEICRYFPPGWDKGDD